jgi:hypothetical protein
MTHGHREELRAINEWLAVADISFDAIAAGYDKPEMRRHLGCTAQGSLMPSASGTRKGRCLDYGQIGICTKKDQYRLKQMSTQWLRQ